MLGRVGRARVTEVNLGALSLAELAHEPIATHHVHTNTVPQACSWWSWKDRNC